MVIRKIAHAALAVFILTHPAIAADPIINDLPPEPPAIDLAERGIWGAIAYSETDGKRGIFWGADTRAEADANAQKYCDKAGGAACKVVTTFRNHRHWSDNDGSGFPYEPCATLAVSASSIAKWGVATDIRGKNATAAALAQCGSSDCKIVEKVCT